MIQLCIIPGPEKVKNYHSVLESLMQKLKKLETDGVKAVKNGVTYHTRVHLLAATGDLPAVASLMNHTGHTSKFGCRICETQGEHLYDSSHGMYFPGEDAVALRCKEIFQNGNPVSPTDPVRTNALVNPQH